MALGERVTSPELCSKARRSPAKYTPACPKHVPLMTEKQPGDFLANSSPAVVPSMAETPRDHTPLLHSATLHHTTPPAARLRSRVLERGCRLPNFHTRS